MKIDDLRKINRLECIIITQHSRKRLAEREIRIEDILHLINNGEIIEDYPDDKPFPSCLVLGKVDDKAIHVVVSTDGDNIYIVTAYIPSENKWMPDMKTRKEDKQ